ncbi:hypothetical protein [Arthrobacter sp. RCC_34]|uniref:hypothetical protein n=1 Tax=Arthrobacter sp. RCC_34 TaxID=3239230 RepID=UPI00352685A5
MTLTLWLQIAALAVPAAVAIFSAIWASRSARRAQHSEQDSARLRALEDRVAQKKYELYLPFLQTLGDMLTPSRNAAATKRLEDTMADFQTFVTVWGSDEVVETFYRYRTSANTSPPPLIVMRLMADFLVAVRRDVAWPDTSILNLHVIGMRINDLPEHPEMVEALSMPLSELFERENWSAPFDLNRVH